MRDRLQPLWALVCLMCVLPAIVRASTLDALVADLGGNDDVARSRARLLLPREDSVEAVRKILPLIRQDNQIVWRAAFNTLADIGAAVSVPGREAERAEVSKLLMTLVAADQPVEIQKRGLRLLPTIIPAGLDVGPIAALLASTDPIMQEKARAALQEAGTPEARTALRAFLPKAKPDFQCAVLDSLGALKDADSLKAIEQLAQSPDAKVRAAAAGALAWTGDPFRLKTTKAVVAAADEGTRAQANDAMIRLVNAIEERGGNWEIAVAAYKEMVSSPDPIVKDAGLAGLGRIGDGSCVGAVLAATADAQPPTWQIGLDALRRMQGVDVARALVTEYPKQPPKLQLALLEALGSKKHPMVLPVLTTAAKSEDPQFRLAALKALGETNLAEALPVLTEAGEKRGQSPEGQVASAGILNLAAALRAQGNKQAAGQAYTAAMKAIGTPDELRTALEGITACPVPQAIPAAQQAAQMKELRGPAARAMVAIGGALNAAGKKGEAVKAYEAARGMDNSPELMKLIATGMRDAGAAKEYAAMLGLITHWWVVGPFDLGENNAGWGKAYIGEPDVSLNAKYMAGKSRITWDAVKASDDRGIVDLLKTIAKGDNLIAYAYTEVTVEKDTDAILLVGADDSERVWVNGQKVFELFVPRAITPDQDKIPVKLKAGKNAILMKIWQNTLGWEFCARLTTRDGSPLAFAQKAQ